MSESWQVSERTTSGLIQQPLSWKRPKFDPSRTFIVFGIPLCLSIYQTKVLDSPSYCTMIEWNNGFSIDFVAYDVVIFSVKLTISKVWPGCEKVATRVYRHVLLASMIHGTE